MAVNRQVMIFLLGVTLCGAATEAGATTARLAALGLGPDWVNDEREAIRWYASGVDHGGVASMEPGRLDAGGDGQAWSDRIAGQGGGAHIRFDEAGKWGTAAAYFHSQAVQAAPSNVYADYPGGGITLLYAVPAGPLDFGVGFLGTSYLEFDNGDNIYGFGRSEWHHDIGAGVRWRLSPGVRLETAGEWRNVQSDFADRGRGIDGNDDNNWDGFAWRARLRLQLSDKVTLVPLCDYTREIRGIYSLQLDDRARLDAWQLRLGFVFTVRQPDATMLFFGAEYVDGKEDQDSYGSPYRRYDTQLRDWYSIHARAALETPLNSWLTVRASVQYRRVDDSPVLYWPEGAVIDSLDWEERGRIGVDTPLGFGLSAALHRFRLDLAYNDKAPLSVANVPDANSPREAANFATLSLLYRY